jgi:hypothetical protein
MRLNSHGLKAVVFVKIFRRALAQLIIKSRGFNLKYMQVFRMELGISLFIISSGNSIQSN